MVNSTIRIVECPNCRGAKETRGEKYFRCCNNQYLIEEHLYNNKKAKEEQTEEEEENKEMPEDTEEFEKMGEVEAEREYNKGSSSSNSPVKIKDIEPETKNTMKNQSNESEEPKNTQNQEKNDKSEWEQLNPASRSHKEVIVQEYGVPIKKAPKLIKNLKKKGYSEIHTGANRIR